MNPPPIDPYVREVFRFEILPLVQSVATLLGVITERLMDIEEEVLADYLADLSQEVGAIESSLHAKVCDDPTCAMTKMALETRTEMN